MWNNFLSVKRKYSTKDVGELLRIRIKWAPYAVLLLQNIITDVLPRFDLSTSFYYLKYIQFWNNCCIFSFSLFLSLFLPTSLCVCVYVSLSLSLTLSLSSYLSVCLSLCMCVCVCLSLSLSLYLSLSLSLSLSPLPLCLSLSLRLLEMDDKKGHADGYPTLSLATFGLYYKPLFTALYDCWAIIIER